MISFEVLRSEDPEFQGEYLNHFDSFLLGSSLRADIVIQDPNIHPLHLSLEVKDQVIICRSHEKENTFLVNNKKYSGTKVIKAQDVLTIGETELKIVNYATSEKREEPSIDELYAAAIEKVPQLEEVIIQLEREILFLDKKLLENDR